MSNIGERYLEGCDNVLKGLEQAAVVVNEALGDITSNPDEAERAAIIADLSLYQRKILGIE